MNNENTTLKPCPFCGSNCVNDTLPPEPECGSYCWVCPDCVCCGGIGYTVEEATKAWNTRPLEDALKAKAQAYDMLCGLVEAININMKSDDLNTALEQAKELTE